MSSNPIRPFSQGRAIKIIQQSVAHALAKDEPTREGERGTIIHGMVLGGASTLEVVQKTDAKTGVVEPAGDYRTKSAQEHRDAIRAAGRVPVLADELESFKRTSESIRSQLSADGFLGGSLERSIEWLSDGVPCRGRLDELQSDLGIGDVYIADLKTCDNAAQQSSDASIYRMGYDIQAAAYIEAVETTYPDLVGRLTYYLHFAELDVLDGGARNIITVKLGGSMLEIGKARWRRARSLWKRAHETGVFPGYSREVRTAEAPEWAMAQETYAMAGTMGPSREVDF
jgi:PDDEXK-like domain of unknown function (DUF3799)